MDGRKSSIIAKVCAQVSTYYSGALAQCEQSNSKNDDEPISECLGDRACKQMMR